AADKLNKPVIVHTRAAQDDTLELIRHQQSVAAGVLHCFTESWEMASQALDMGYYISISGIVTFRNADNVREVAQKIPLDRLLIETDAPYLAPFPYRGKSNEPAYLVNTAEFLADLRRLSLDQLIEATTDNFYRLFPSAKASGQALAVNS
ncbi:MAG: TatD family hydrolase, partial [Pseudomonadales bacterium]